MRPRKEKKCHHVNITPLRLVIVRRRRNLVYSRIYFIFFFFAHFTPFVDVLLSTETRDRVARVSQGRVVKFESLGMEHTNQTHDTRFVFSSPRQVLGTEK